MLLRFLFKKKSIINKMRLGDQEVILKSQIVDFKNETIALASLAQLVWALAHHGKVAGCWFSPPLALGRGKPLVFLSLPPFPLSKN